MGAYLSPYRGHHEITGVIAVVDQPKKGDLGISIVLVANQIVTRAKGEDDSLQRFPMSRSS